MIRAALSAVTPSRWQAPRSPEALHPRVSSRDKVGGQQEGPMCLRLGHIPADHWRQDCRPLSAAGMADVYDRVYQAFLQVG